MRAINCCICLIMIAFGVYAQNKPPKEYPTELTYTRYDPPPVEEVVDSNYFKVFQFGLSISLQKDKIHVKETDWKSLGLDDDIRLLEMNNQLGISLGLVFKYNISPYIGVRLQTIASLQDNRLLFGLKKIGNHWETVAPISVEVPVHVTVTPFKSRNTIWFFSGLHYIRDITNRGDTFKLDLAKNDFAFDIGAGVQLNFGNLLIKPEFIWSKGLLNLESNNNNLFDTAIKSMYRDKFAIRVIIL